MKKLFAVLCFLACPVGATVLIDTQTAGGNPSAGVITWNMTIGTGINRAVLIGCETNSGLGISSATVAGSTTTKILQSVGSQDLAEMWISTNPPSGSQTITVYGNSSSMGCGAIAFENVNLTSPIDVSTGAFVDTANPSVTWTTTVSTTMLVDVIGQGTDNNVGVPGTGQTLQWSHNDITKFITEMGSTKDGGLAGSKTLSWTLTSTKSAMVATALKSASGAPDISTLSPSTKGINEGAFTLTVNGQNFVSGATVTWNGANRATTFINSTQLTAVILSTDIANIAAIPVRVINPDTARTAIVTFNVTGDVTFVYATDGGYKPTEDDLYGTTHPTTVAATRIWDGVTAKPFQAKNELNGFALVLENNSVINSTSVRVGYPVLTGPNGYVISSTPAAPSTLWDWRNRPIELYYVRYVPIQGLSTINWGNYDETHVPERFQATYTLSGNQGVRTGGWTTRADHDKYYPEIMVPMEAVTGSTFTVASSSSQVVWVDIFVPKEAPAGLYSGSIPIYEGPQLSTTIPISLTVYPFTMPDTPYSKPYAYLSLPNVNLRHGGVAYPNYVSISSGPTQTRLHYYQELHRFGITPAGDSQDGGCGNLTAGPCPEFQMQLDGSLYAASTGYANAPGVSTPEPLYMMFAYTSWRGKSFWPTTYAGTCANANIWVQWFQSHAPKAEYFWYLEDEATNQTNNNTYAGWVSTCPAPGNMLASFATSPPERTLSSAPYVTIAATTKELGIANTEESAIHSYQTSVRKRVDYYNGSRPWNGTLMTEDDGVAMRVMSWLQYKKKFDHYFIWETTNYDSEGGTVQNNLFHNAKTFGYYGSDSAILGRTGFSYNNGDGVLLYPGTDTQYPADSYGVDVPFPSWRLMLFRRGINDFTYLTIASQYDPKAVEAIVQSIIPKVIWEYGVVDTTDPTYQYGPKSWSSDPDVWERARESLAQIIARHR